MPQLQPGMARIRVKDLCLRTFIGINEEEILNTVVIVGSHDVTIDIIGDEIR